MNKVEFMKQVLMESKEELPTLELQLLSLTSFMRSNGYEPIGTNGQNFKLVEDYKYYPKTLNWKAAVVLHNIGSFVKAQPNIVPNPFRSYFANQIVSLNRSTKIVESVYLQWSKRKCKWVVTSNKVKLV